ncbi:MAG: CehA/McbA family metallohydrolase [Planctomycetaceae bacterium]|nr:CehA/McbA family metallohydrolase [Planctomycetaceae bacterium]
MTLAALAGCWLMIGCMGASVFGQSGPVVAVEDSEDLLFTPPGFDTAGFPKWADGDGTATLEINVRDARSDAPLHCRMNVLGPDGNFYQPAQNHLTQYALTGDWPKQGEWGNRKGKAPFRYFGRFFYSTGQTTVRVPAGSMRVEVWRGYDYRPATLLTTVKAGEARTINIDLEQQLPPESHGYYSGDAHVHVPRTSDADDDTIFDLVQAEDIRYTSLLAYNEPAGPYAGFMDRLDSPQRRGIGRESIVTRGDFHLLSGQEYRTGTYGHLNLFLRDDIVFPGQDFDANNWPLYGDVGRDTITNGGYAIYAHGGYAQAIYADAVQGNVNAVELLQFGVYRGIGLVDWYNLLNCGYRFPCVGASDWPACRKLGDCVTYVQLGQDKSFSEWLKGAAEGRSFATTGPILLLEVNGRKPGDTVSGDAPITVTAQVRANSLVAPITNVQLIVNGTVAHEQVVSPTTGEWIELELPVEVNESSWLAARAFSLSPGGAADAESHTNPVYVCLNGKAPYHRASLDAIVGQIDKQLDLHSKRQFPEQARVLAYFQRSRDLLLEVRANDGLPADPHVAAARPLEERLEGDGSLEVSDDELAEFLKPVPPKEPAEALETFEMLDGFEMQFVAAEPLVVDPVAGAFDENGNLYVCELRDYPFKPAEGGTPIGTVRVLRDVDGDGTFDESHLFAENLLWAAGIQPWKGGVFVTAPPDIWYMKDTNGDFVADEKTKVYTGFGTGNQQAMLNNLTLGLDFKVYGSTAGNGGEVTTLAKPRALPVSVTGHDFRFDPVSGEFESITGTVQFGNTFDDWGNRFLCSESQPLRHAVLPQEYLERNPYVPVSDPIQNIAPGPVPCFRISPIERWRHIRSSRRVASASRAATAAGASHHVIDAAAGVTVYRGGAYPPEFYGNVFIGDGQNNLVHRRRLVPDGVTFTSERVDVGTEFCRSSDIWFRPVNFINAPDGTLYCLDLSREVLEAIHIPLDVVRHLDLASGRDRGRIYRMAPAGFQSPPPPKLGSASTAELVAALESPHGWWQDTAQRLLYERQDTSAAPQLKELLLSSDRPQARLRALCLLQGLGILEESGLSVGLHDPHPAVRAHAIRLSERRLDQHEGLLVRVLELAEDTEPTVRFQVALSLGESRDENAAAMLADLLRAETGDPWMRSAILSSLSGPAVHVFEELIDDDAFAGSDTGRTMLRQLVEMVGARHAPEEVRTVLEVIATNGGTTDRQRELLLALGRGLGQSGHVLAVEDGAAPAGARLLNETQAAMNATAADANAGDAARIAAIDFLGCVPLDLSRDVLAELVHPHEPPAVQIAAVRALAGSNSPEVLTLLLERWPQTPPDVRTEVIGAMLARDERCREFLEAMRDDPQQVVAQISGTQRQLLLAHRDAEIRGLAEEVFATATDAARSAIVAAYRPALATPGDAERGQAVFVKNCAVCHRLGDIGTAVGPNLTASQDRAPDAVLANILDPNKYVAPNYVQYVVLDTAGRTHTGLIGSQSATSLALVREKGETETILRADVEELLSTGKSLMPEGLEKVITPEEMADLVRFVTSARPTEPQSDEEARQARDFGTDPGLIEPPR